jgi:uncharacterized membrane protein
MPVSKPLENPLLSRAYWAAFLIAFLIAFIPTEVLYRLSLIPRSASDVMYFVLWLIILFPIYSFMDRRLGNRPESKHLTESTRQLSRLLEVGLFIVLMLAIALGILLLGLL